VVVIEVPQRIALFAAGLGVMGRAAVVNLAGYYWSLVVQLILRTYALACLKGWKS
jgi:hypothetical protein